MVDRFNNPTAGPRHAPFDDPAFADYQGGKFSGVQAQLPYVKALGAGAIWLSPVLKNLPLRPVVSRLRHPRFHLGRAPTGRQPSEGRRRAARPDRGAPRKSCISSSISS